MICVYSRFCATFVLGGRSVRSVGNEEPIRGTERSKIPAAESEASMSA